MNGIAFCGIDARRPRDPADLLGLRVGLARLDLARVQDQHVAAGRVGDVGAVAVVAERHAVRDDVALPEHVRVLGVAHVDRGDRRGRGAGRVVRAPVLREAALVPEARERLGELELGVAAVGVRVVERDDAGVGRRVARHRRQQAAPRVERQRLVRREHRELGQQVGLLRMGRVGHVEDDDADALGVDVEGVEREEQRGVVVRALVSRGVDVAQDLEAARRALMGEHRHVALQAVGRRARGHPSLDAGLRLGPRPARRPRRRLDRRRGRHLHLGLGGRLARALAEREQVVQRVARDLRADDRCEQSQRQQREQDGTGRPTDPVHRRDSSPIRGPACRVSRPSTP